MQKIVRIESENKAKKRLGTRQRHGEIKKAKNAMKMLRNRNRERERKERSLEMYHLRR